MHTVQKYCPRPLVVRCGALGDMVLLTALIQELHARFRCPVDILTSGPWSEPLLREQPGVGDIMHVRSRSTPYWFAPDRRRAVQRLRLRGVGPTWFCDGSKAARSMLTRAGTTADFIVDVKDHPAVSREHTTEHWRRFARILPAAVRDTPVPETGSATGGGCNLQVAAAWEADLAMWLRTRGLSNAPLILVQAGNKRTMRRLFGHSVANTKYWPKERWALVLRHLRQENSRHAILLLGAGHEHALNREIAALANIEGLHNVADDLPIPRLLALLARATALITVDSGPAHAAAAVGCPQVVLFGSASPSYYRPWGTSGAAVAVLVGQVNGEPNIRGISAEAVIEAWSGLDRNGGDDHQIRQSQSSEVAESAA